MGSLGSLEIGADVGIGTGGTDEAGMGLGVELVTEVCLSEKSMDASYAPPLFGDAFDFWMWISVISL